MRNKVDMQKELNTLYTEYYTQAKMAELTDLDKLSSPFVLNVTDNYIHAPVKIMFVGKEVNRWGKNLNQILNEQNLVEHMRVRYENELLKECEWNQSAFFLIYKKIRENLTDNTTGTVIWNNLLKFSYDSGKGYSKNSINHKGVVELSKNIFKKELDILQPHFVIFATSTGSGYDQLIKDCFPEYTTIEIIEPNNLWKFKIGSTICYRTRHPNATKFKGKKTVKQYYEDIIEDIKLILSKPSVS